MNHVAQQCADAETRLGHDSKLVDVAKAETWDETAGADVHVMHTALPDPVRVRGGNYKLVFVPHGTPEHVVENVVDGIERGGYAPGDAWMLLKNWLHEADATVTFWHRHQWVYQQMVPKAARPSIHFVPLGVDTAFWRGGTCRGKYAGEPSVWMSENQHRIKWGLDVLMAWPAIRQALPLARLHANYIPTGLLKIFYDLTTTNGAGYTSWLASATYDHANLRDIFASVDFLVSPVRYGDHNNLFMQAAAAGMQTVSYPGNEYADYWMPQGDQREMAKALIPILRGDVDPRPDKLPVPELEDMGRAMIAVYESL